MMAFAQNDGIPDHVFACRTYHQGPVIFPEPFLQAAVYLLDAFAPIGNRVHDLDPVVLDQEQRGRRCSASEDDPVVSGVPQFRGKVAPQEESPQLPVKGERPPTLILLVPESFKPAKGPSMKMSMASVRADLRRSEPFPRKAWLPDHFPRCTRDTSRQGERQL